VDQRRTVEGESCVFVRRYSSVGRLLAFIDSTNERDDVEMSE